MENICLSDSLQGLGVLCSTLDKLREGATDIPACSGEPCQGWALSGGVGLQRVEISRNRGPKWNDAPRGGPRRCASPSGSQFRQCFCCVLLSSNAGHPATAIIFFAACEACQLTSMSWLAVHRPTGGAPPLQTATGAGPPLMTGGVGEEAIAVGPPHTSPHRAGAPPPMSPRHAGALPLTSPASGVALPSS